MGAREGTALTTVPHRVAAQGPFCPTPCTQQQVLWKQAARSLRGHTYSARNIWPQKVDGCECQPTPVLGEPSQATGPNAPQREDPPPPKSCWNLAMLQNPWAFPSLGSSLPVLASAVFFRQQNSLHVTWFSRARPVNSLF